MKPKYYKPKSPIVEAIKFEYTKECIDAVKELCGDSFGGYQKHRHPTAIGEFWIKPSNKQEKYHVMEGYYIIKTLDGRLYPCKSDIFEKTYGNGITTPIRLEGGTKWICDNCAGTLEDDIHYFSYCPFCGSYVKWPEGTREIMC